MISLNQFDDVFNPLLARAKAPLTYPNRGFRDMAAEILVKKLNLDSALDSFELPDRTKLQEGLKRTHWIDQQLIEFFTQYPDGLGVEIQSGLSTRFQRVSMQLDWPQFKWIDTDTPDIAECAHLIFPPTDNYQFISSENPWKESSLFKTATPGQACVLVFEHVTQLEKEEEFGALISNILNIAKEKSLVIRIVTDVHQSAAHLLDPIIAIKNSEVRDNQNHCQSTVVTQKVFDETPSWITYLPGPFKNWMNSNDKYFGYVLEVNGRRKE